MAGRRTDGRGGWRVRLRRLLGLGPGLDPQALFERFKSVLAGNNRALETITDLGEKLGGYYLFDINYTRDAYARLLAAVTGAMDEFDILTGGVHPELREVLARIDRRVRRILEEDVPGPDPLLVFHQDITWDLAELVGGKNYNLALIANDIGLPTPPAFAVTTRAFDLFMAANRLDVRVRGLDPADDAGLAALREAVLAADLPPELEAEFGRAVRRLGGSCLLAVRSSGEDEDGEFSFAGQFESVLNVPAAAADLGRAWRRVVASMFAPGAVAYQRQLGCDPGRMKMAAACVRMVEAVKSGVIHTAAGPGRGDTMLINAAWGLGPAVVDGVTDADLYRVGKGDPPGLLETRIGRKEVMAVGGGESGSRIVPTPEADRGRPCLERDEVVELARLAVRMEEYFRGPQDIEWAIDGRGGIFILQSRPLRVDVDAERETDAAGPGSADLPVLLSGRGEVVSSGVTAGRVFIVSSSRDLDRVPRGAVLVARHDSPRYVRVVPFVNAVITDTGVATGHMASICREFAVPTVVNAVDATRVLPAGREVTLWADADGGVKVYAGVARDLLGRKRDRDSDPRRLYEFRRQKYLMRYIAPLHLVNPLEDDFAAHRCRSVHDLIRFMHEMSVQALVAGAARQADDLVGRLTGRRAAPREIDLPLPVRMMLIDIGGALPPGSGRRVGPDDLRCRPLRAILAGMLASGAWRDESMALTGRNFVAGMTRAAAPDAAAGLNLAVASADYVNLSLRFGYHLNVLDSYCSAFPRDNHIFFRFVGGAATLTSRSLRIRFMARVMDAWGFMTRVRGDLLMARISNLPADEVERLLGLLGRLTGHVRQMDAVIESEAEAERLAGEFLERQGR